MNEFKIGDKVFKVKGYKWPGVVVAAFTTIAGERRYVVECTEDAAAGALHIYNGDQLAIAHEPGKDFYVVAYDKETGKPAYCRVLNRKGGYAFKEMSISERRLFGPDQATRMTIEEAVRMLDIVTARLDEMGFTGSTWLTTPCIVRA